MFEHTVTIIRTDVLTMIAGHIATMTLDISASFNAAVAVPVPFF
jgi:hypothetical protein